MLVWAEFCSYGKTKLIKVECRLNAGRYDKMLEEDVLPWAGDFMPVTWKFQQNNALANSARSTKDRFR